ncbi:MAG: MoxR family ATPase [Cyanobacteria bacterium P01_C01_bin.38]
MTNNKKEPPSTPNYEYTGNYQPPKEIENKNEDYKKKLKIYCPYPYLPSNDLKEAVNLAIKLERPLLLEGEPGCGKTRLAGALAYEFTKKNQEFLQGLENPKQETEIQETGSQETEIQETESKKTRNQKNQNQETTNQEDDDNIKQWWDYYIWNIKSTTRARDGLYRYDAVTRLRDAQLMGTNPDKLQEFIGEEETEKLKERLKDKKNYLEFGALGKALGKALGGDKKVLGKDNIEHDYRPVLLIDEIDKADSDFANDLLLELEELRFEIPEIADKENRHEIPTPKHKPIIFITSNREKPLPEPFLRRCIYFYVAFPNQEQLENIINKRFDTLKKNKKILVEDAIEIFYKIRNLLEKNPGSKPPGTSEFIDFIKAILDGKDKSKDLTKRELDKKKEDLNNLFDKTPLLGILLKSKTDYDLIVDKLKNKENEDNQ